MGYVPDSMDGERRMKIAFCFPGQGSQTVGMGVAFAEASPAAAAVFAQASDAYGSDLLDLCRTGPQSVLDQTEITQPALTTASAACHAGATPPTCADSAAQPPCEARCTGLT